MKTKVIKFVHSFTPYKKGECAGFPEERADFLINRGYAIATTSARDKDATAIRAISSAPETRDIKGPEATKTKTTPAKKPTTRKGKAKTKKS